MAFTYSKRGIGSPEIFDDQNIKDHIGSEDATGSDDYIPWQAEKGSSSEKEDSSTNDEILSASQTSRDSSGGTTPPSTSTTGKMWEFITVTDPELGEVSFDLCYKDPATGALRDFSASHLASSVVRTAQDLQSKKAEKRVLHEFLSRACRAFRLDFPAISKDVRGENVDEKQAGEDMDALVDVVLREINEQAREIEKHGNTPVALTQDLEQSVKASTSTSKDDDEDDLLAHENKPEIDADVE